MEEEKEDAHMSMEGLGDMDLKVGDIVGIDLQGVDESRNLVDFDKTF